MANAACCTPPNIDQLKDQLKQTEKELATKTKEKEALKENIDNVERTQTDLKKGGDDYKKALDGFKASKKDFGDYYALKWRMVLCAIEKCKDDIDSIIDANDTKIECQRYKVDELRDKESELKSSHDQAVAVLNEKKISFEEYRNYKDKIEKLLKDVQGLKTKTEKEDDANHPASMYVLLRELNITLDQVDLISPDDLEKRVQDRWCEYYEATNEARDAKAKLDEISQELKLEEALLNELQQKRLETILNNVSKYNAQASCNPHPCPPQPGANRRQGASLQ
jgi:hypothetical protein